jgi:hypothetical protein
MIAEITMDIRYFMFVLLLAVIGFGNGFFILAKTASEEDLFTGDSFLMSLVFSYRMGLGDFDTTGFEGEYKSLIYTIWVCNTIFILIILLNLVIALMGDTFDRVQETAENSLLRELS